MKLVKLKISSDRAHVVPISDLHIGDRAFNEESIKILKQNIEWIRRKKHARVFLVGDILNCGTKESPTSLFDQKLDLDRQIEFAVELFKPIKKKIIGAIDGNHEQRLTRFAGFSPTKTLCSELGTVYCGNSAVVLLKLGKKEKHNFILFFHHTSGGGTSVGSKINRIEKLRNLCLNADIFVGSHNHMVAVIPLIVNEIDKRMQVVREKKQFLVDSGSYLTWDGTYAEAKMMPPMKIGSPRILLLVKKKIWDIFISI